ncbi:unnamed protein product, partial [Brassica oleracea var. botrytis]
MPRMCDLGEKLVVEIFKRVPITSLKAVRSTCKTWEAITKSWVVLGKKAADEFLLGFVKMNNKVYSLRYHQGDVSVQQVDLLNQLEISAVYHCDGLVLCVAKDLLKLVVWNPYLCQSRWIGPRGESFEASDIYAIGYSEDKNKKRDHKILRLVDDNCVAGPVLNVFRCEIYEMSSSDSSWRLLEEAKPNGQRVGRRMMPRMCDLGEKLVVEIFKRVPITSLKAVRSTCKTWEAITKSWVVLGKKAADEFLLGFVKMNNKVYSLRYHQGDVSVQQVDLLNQLEISAVYHCDGLVLCVANDLSKLVVWNPYLCQSRWIGPRGESFEASDIYAIGYSEDKNKKRDHKILRLVDDNCVAGPVLSVFRCEIYEMSSSDSSWRVLEEAKPKWEIDVHQRGASVNGNTYFFAHDRVDDIEPDADGSIPVDGVEDSLLCFDFTKERFGPRLPLPFHSFNEDCVTLSSFLRGDGDDEQLAALFGGCESSFFEIWLTLTLVEPDHVSWTKFLLVETGGPIFTSLHFQLSTYFGGSFFVDEENKVAVVFELDSYISISAPPPSQHTAFVFGQAGYIQSVNLGQALKLQHLSRYSGKHCQALLPPLVCSSSFRPTLVQVNQLRDK